MQQVTLYDVREECEKMDSRQATVMSSIRRMDNDTGSEPSRIPRTKDAMKYHTHGA